MRIQIEPRIANERSAHQWLDRILYKIVDGWHVWDTTDQADPEQMAATTWILESSDRVREMLIASVQRAAWSLKPHGRSVRVTTNPRTPDELLPEDAARLAEEPLYILVENRFSDGAFVERIIKELDQSLHKLWGLNSRPVRIDGPGGKGEMAKEVERRARELGHHARLVAVVDSDRKTPGANPSRDARKLLRTCCARKLPCWILAKRETENYLPRILLSARPNVGADHQRLVAAWDRLTDDQKNFLDMKSGLRRATTAAEQRLFAGLRSADRNTLQHGFGQGVDACWTLPNGSVKSELVARGQGDLELGIKLIRSAL